MSGWRSRPIADGGSRESFIIAASASPNPALLTQRAFDRSLRTLGGECTLRPGAGIGTVRIDVEPRVERVAPTSRAPVLRSRRWSVGNRRAGCSPRPVQFRRAVPYDRSRASQIAGCSRASGDKNAHRLRVARWRRNPGGPRTCWLGRIAHHQRRDLADRRAETRHRHRGDIVGRESRHYRRQRIAGDAVRSSDADEFGGEVGVRCRRI